MGFLCRPRLLRRPRWRALRCRLRRCCRRSTRFRRRVRPGRRVPVCSGRFRTPLVRGSRRSGRGRGSCRRR
jgi:hypothetical protein